MWHSTYKLRTRLALAVAALALAPALAAQPASAAPHAPGAPAQFFGVNSAWLRALTHPSQAATLNGLAASMEAQGIDWARTTFDQAMDNRLPGQFNWSATDAIITALASHNVRAAGAFIHTAWWTADPTRVAECGPRSYPSLIEGWRDWVAAAAKRYGNGGRFWDEHPELPRLPIRQWEIGNEVNTKRFWCPGANPEQYAKVYSASLNAITAVDPQAEVIVAGLAPIFGPQAAGDLDVPSFLRRMTAADPSLRSRIHSVAIHPYAPTADGVIATVAQFRQAMTGAGLSSTPMIANEFGWYTQGQGAWALLKDSEANRAAKIASVTNRIWRLDCGVKGVAPYSWITMERDAGYSEDWFGLANAETGEPHPSGLAYGYQIKLARGMAAAPPPTGTYRACSAPPTNAPPAGDGCQPPTAKRTRLARMGRTGLKLTATLTGEPGPILLKLSDRRGALAVANLTLSASGTTQVRWRKRLKRRPAPRVTVAFVPKGPARCTLTQRAAVGRR